MMGLVLLVTIVLFFLGFGLTLMWLSRRRERIRYLDWQRQKQAREQALAERIDHWHQGHMSMPLHEYLGMTQEQYERWLKDPDAIL